MEITCHAEDPPRVDWAACELPAAWPDHLNFAKPSHLARLLWRVVRGGRKGRPVELPAGLPGADELPRYLLQEFHRIPNGNFSSKMARGYARWFDRTMLGRLDAQRRQAAASVAAGAGAALDLGCGTGGFAAALLAAGVSDVWGVDASPYLLREAAQRVPGARFVHGLAERLPFPAERFDVVAASFVFHELPADVARAALREARRVLKPGGRLVVIEPSPKHYHARSPFAALLQGGPFSLYFRVLSHFVHEPFVLEWHANEPKSWLAGGGFALDRDVAGVPLRVIEGTALP